jgi:hypothetical protein
LDLTLKECSILLPSQGIFSHPFYLAGKEFHLVGGHGLAEASNSGTFGLYLEMQWDPEDSKPIILEFFLKRAGAKALPPFQLIKEKRTRVQEYKIQITTTLPASNHPNAWPRHGPKALPQL